jgi:putative membrane protein
MNRKSSMLMSLGISIALIAAAIWFLWNHQSRFGFGDGGWNMSYHMMMGGAGLGIVMILFWAAVLAAIGLVISGAIVHRRSSGGTDRQHTSDARETPKQRHARSEIDTSRFETMKHDVH